jgi:hypothetical protein
MKIIENNGNELYSITFNFVSGKGKIGVAASSETTFMIAANSPGDAYKVLKDELRTELEGTISDFEGHLIENKRKEKKLIESLLDVNLIIIKTEHICNISDIRFK